MTENSDFIDNGNGTVTDTRYDLTWVREDSWQSEKKWVTWDEALQYAQDHINLKFAGYEDWRLPERDEIVTLFDPAYSNRNKQDDEIKLHPIFPAGCLTTVWTQDGIGQDGYIIDFATGELRLLYKSKSGRMAARPVRGKPFSQRT